MPRRKSKSDFPAAIQESTPLDVVIEQAGLITGEQLSVQECARRLGVSGDPEPVVQIVLPEDSEPTAVRPSEPRKRAPGEPFGLHGDTVNKFRLDKKGRYLEFVFEDEPDNERIRKLYQNGFYRKAGTTTWASPASAQQIDRAYAMANEFSGKTERYGVYGERGR